MIMNRRNFLSASAASAACGLFASVARAAPGFTPQRFSVQVQGTGPDVILIPGLTASREIWRGTVTALPGYRYHLIQVAGFAGEPVRGNARGEVVGPLAEELARYIAARGLRRPAIVGHSMGGTIAMMIAARHAGLVGKVMAVDMLPQPSGLFGADPNGVRGLADSLRDIAAAPGGRELVASLMGMFGNPTDPRSRSDPDVVARATHDLALIDLSDELPRITAPLTIVYASPDTQSRDAVDRTYAQAYRRAPTVKRIRIDNSGHMIMYDQPAKFRAAVASFLRS